MLLLAVCNNSASIQWPRGNCLLGIQFKWSTWHVLAPIFVCMAHPSSPRLLVVHRHAVRCTSWLLVVGTSLGCSSFGPVAAQ